MTRLSMPSNGVIDTNIQDPSVTAKITQFITSRRATCTHTTFTRLYGPHKCSHCNRVSCLGWVYRCTQDKIHDDYETEDLLETLKKASSVGMQTGTECISSTGTDRAQLPKMPELFDGTSGDSQRVNLSRWIEQAVSKGQYTSEKITTLRAQRQRVVELVANAESEVSQQELKMIQRRPSVKHNSTGNHGPNRTAATVQQTPEETVLGTSSSSDLDRSGTTSTPGLRLQPECEYKTCQICRPYAKDRAWQCFGHALNPSASLSVIEISNDNRPISNATLVRRIGLWQPNSGPRQSESFGDIALADDADGDQSKMIASRRSNGLQSESRTKSPIGSHTTTGQVIDGKASLSHRDSKLGRDSKDSSLSWLDKGKWKADGDGPERTECRNRLRKNFTGEDQLALKFGRGKKPCHQDYSLMNNDEYIIRNGKDQEIRVQDGLVGKEEGVDLGIADIIVEG